MLGWSHYRIRYETNKGKILITHSVPVFYKSDRMSKGEIIVPDELGNKGKAESKLSSSEFNGQRLVFVLRNKDGEEFYVEETLTVEDNRLFLPTTDVIIEGDYMITASTKTQLLGLQVTVR